MQDGGILQKMDEDWKRFLKTNDEAKTSGIRALSPQDIMIASISLAIGITIGSASFFCEHLANKKAELRGQRLDKWASTRTSPPPKEIQNKVGRPTIFSQ